MGKDGEEMKKKILSLILSIGFSITVAVPTIAETDYSYLEDMTIKELRELDAQIHKLLPSEDNPAEESTEEEGTDVNSGMVAISRLDNNEYLSLDELKTIASTNESKFKTQYMDNVVTIISSIDKIESTGKVCNQINSNWYDYGASLMLGNWSLQAYFPKEMEYVIDYKLADINVGDTVMIRGALRGRSIYGGLVRIASLEVVDADTNIEDVAIIPEMNSDVDIFTVPFKCYMGTAADGSTYAQLSYGEHIYTFSQENYDVLKLLLQIGSQDPMDTETIKTLFSESNMEYEEFGEFGSSFTLRLSTEKSRIDYAYNNAKSTYPQLIFQDYYSYSDSKMNWGLKIRPDNGHYGLYDSTY